MVGDVASVAMFRWSIIPFITSLPKSKDMALLDDYSIQMFRSIQILDLYWNNRITNDGIKGMPIHTLNLSCNNNITNDGIEGMPIHTLNLCMNKRITNDGIQCLPPGCKIIK